MLNREDTWKRPVVVYACVQNTNSLALIERDKSIWSLPLLLLLFTKLTVIAVSHAKHSMFRMRRIRLYVYFPLNPLCDPSTLSHSFHLVQRTEQGSEGLEATKSCRNGSRELCMYNAWISVPSESGKQSFSHGKAMPQLSKGQQKTKESRELLPCKEFHCACLCAFREVLPYYQCRV